MLNIMRKVIDINNSEVLYDRQFNQSELQLYWKVCGGEWWVEGEWLTGKHPKNTPGIIISKEDYRGNVMLDFEARTVIPSSHDIDCMWNGSWDEDKNERGVAYVAGIEGWWEGKVGFEKSPEYKFNALTPLMDFKPGRIYHIQVGSIDGHCFIFIDGKLALEFTDPEPIDSQRYAKVGFEAYCSHIQIRNLKIRRIRWEFVDSHYKPEI